MHEFPLIGDQKTLRELTEALSCASEVAIDTEFVRERTYFPKLCLIQVATADTIAGIDCLADLDPGLLLESLCEPNRGWVVHSARQDLEVVWNSTRRMPRRLIDTQIAAALIGFPPQISLRELLEQTIGVALDKAHTRTDWTSRPIADAALRYALDDVRHLLPLWDHLRARLAQLDRLAWLEEDSARLLAAPPVTDAATVFNRLKGVAKLSEQAQLAALALVHWREGEAQRLNRPRRWILSDDLIVEIVRHMPATRAALAAIPEMPRRLVARAGADMLAAIRESNRDEWRAAIAQPARLPDRGLVKSLQAQVNDRARALNLHSEVLATRRDLAAVAAGETPIHLATGWRAAELERALGRDVKRD